MKCCMKYNIYGYMEYIYIKSKAAYVIPPALCSIRNIKDVWSIIS
jgi:hypothetical protein